MKIYQDSTRLAFIYREPLWFALLVLGTCSVVLILGGLVFVQAVGQQLPGQVCGGTIVIMLLVSGVLGWRAGWRLLQHALFRSEHWIFDRSRGMLIIEQHRRPHSVTVTQTVPLHRLAVDIREEHETRSTGTTLYMYRVVLHTPHQSIGLPQARFYAHGRAAYLAGRIQSFLYD